MDETDEQEKDPERRRAHQEELAKTVVDPERTRQFLLDSSLLRSLDRAKSLG